MREHAVVLGASMAGLLAARALADHVEKVTVLERDVLPGAVASRKGVPQGVHVHALLPGGSRVLNRMFPRLLGDLEAAGVPVIRGLGEMHFELENHVFCAGGMPDEPLYLASRPFLEGTVRGYTAPNVTFRQQCTVSGLRARDGRIRGVVVDGPSGAEELSADLVVDATGRGGRTPVWLADLGYPAPPEERIEIDISYVSAHLRMPEVPAGFDDAVVVGANPARPWGIGVLHQEGGLWLLSAYGYRGHHPPQDREALLGLVKEVMPARWFDALLGAEWPDRLQHTRFPASVRRRYDRLDRFPEGLVVVGDAQCSFNPIYGQGMTVAALEAEALRKALRGPDAGLSARYFAAVRKAVDVAWQLGAGGDLAYPMVPGRRPLPMTALNHYVKAILTTAERDPAVARRFLEVAWLLSPPTALLAPAMVARVLRDAARRRAG